MRSILLLCLVALMNSTQVGAKLSSIPVDELIEEASVIVIARVSKLSDATVPAHPDRSGHVTFAEAIAQKTLKGTVPQNFRFLAQTDFICSESGAVKDELALFFLYRDPRGGLSIQAFGNGRMAISELDGQTYVTATSVIVWPKDAPARPGLDERSGSKSVELDYVEKLIRNAVTPAARPAGADGRRSGDARRAD